MKTQFFFSVIILGCVILQSCTETTLLDDPLTESGLMDSKASVGTQCIAKQCLPTVSVYHDIGGTTITWNMPGHTCHRFFLSCNGAGNYKSGTVEDYGTWFIGHESQEYQMEYTISCVDGCSYCSKTEVYKYKDGVGNLGKPNECHKRYVLYSYRGEGDKLFLSYNDDYNPNYLYIDTYEVFKRGYNGNLELIAFGNVNLNGTLLPLSSHDTHEVRFYSRDCEKSREEHYLYFSFFGNSMGWGYLSELKAHH